MGICLNYFCAIVWCNITHAIAQIYLESFLITNIGTCMQSFLMFLILVIFILYKKYISKFK